MYVHKGERNMKNEITQQLNNLNFKDMYEDFISYIDVSELTLKSYGDYYGDIEPIENSAEMRMLKSVYSSQLASDGLLGYCNDDKLRGQVILPLGMEFLDFISDKSEASHEE